MSKLTSIIQEVWEDIMKSPWKYVGKKADEIIQDKIDKIMERKACDLAAMWKDKPKKFSSMPTTIRWMMIIRTSR